MGHISGFVVFSEGLLSFFSPCVLSILPIYLAILSGSNVKSIKEGDDNLKDSPLLKNTILFVLGVSTTFFILGTSINAISQFFTKNKETMNLIGGIIIMIMGLLYSGYLNLPFLQKGKRLNVDTRQMKPWTAYLLGFSFSFGWSPCVGPMLASVLIIASNSKSVLAGNLLILVYTIGFTLPFILIAIFYDKLFKYVDKIKLHMSTIQKIGGIILLLTGLVMTLGGTDKVIGYFKNSNKNVVEYNEEISDEYDEEDTKIPAIDFTLVDQYGNTHTISEYKGKVIFLNFWATWCPPCRMEMPDIEAIYEEYEKNSGDVIILGVAAPNLGKEGSEEHIKKFLKDNGYTYPVVFDQTGDILGQYSIQAFPTTFVIDKDGNLVSYVPGAVDKEFMKMLIDGGLERK
ncbi:cytochrome c biogenesis protein/redoxin [Sporanaerobacter acetigenes]|uniref:Cytochrome c-type biogenesis protein n=2 Tax=Sporanaerobacter acetigenes TaxID=165813 RepID=A0A1M5UNI1_9FIRM|nr:cytochrome c biogenesis protein/redoxin [Sporanaerobacter acetigenes]SHH64564.1 cytochrome c-type biogenesis protein [Sporanaerobacter acetigenes DSM 13106]